MLKRIAAPMVVVGAAFVACASITTYYIGHIEESYRHSYAEDVMAVQAADALQTTFWKLHGLAWKLHAVASTSKDPDATAAIREQLGRLADEFQSHLNEVQAISNTDPEKETVAKIRLLFTRYCSRTRGREPFSNIEEFLSHADDPGRSELVHGIADECQIIHDLNSQQVADAARERTRLIKWLNMVRNATVITATLVGGFLGFWISRGLHRSVAQISVTLSDMAGKLGHHVGHVVLNPSATLPLLQEQVQEIALRIQGVLDELQEARHQVLATERLAVAGELAAGVAHEIRNPLTSIKLLIQMASQRGSGQSLGDKQLQVIQREIARMETTIQGLLDFARPSRLHCVAHDLCDTVHRAVNLLDGRARQHRVRICEHFSATPQIINGDPEQVHQVLVNLLVNGIEALPDGGELRVEVGRDEQSSDSCRVVISDSGPGIPADVLPRLFDPFVTTKKDGTGLGLAISRRIIDEHAGTIEAENCAGGGARFTVRLPFGAREPAAPPS
jgi:signal transduction histidine kinase